MTDYLNKLELLAPAGDMEKLKTAITYGADAVYFGGQDYSLRANAKNLSLDMSKVYEMIAINEFKKNLHLISACLRSHFIVNQKFDMERFILFITASRAE